METPTLPLMQEHWPDPAQLELADKAWDQIEGILDHLVKSTGCSNEAIRQLLAKVAGVYLDPADELQEAIKHQQWIDRIGKPFKGDDQRGAA